MASISIKPFIDIDTCHPRLVKKHKKKQFCYICFVSVKRKRLLVKQKRYKGHLVAPVHDVLAARIAESLNVAHKVAIIPAFKKFPGKIYDDWPATIHTLASGATIKEKKSPYKHMNIKQASEGFRREMIPWLAKHHQLIKIVALDIFLCNHDRHRGNLFYNAQTDCFCAIDMDLLYEFNLPLYAHNNLTCMMEKGRLFPLTTKEVFALLELRKTLEFLAHYYPPEKTIQMFNDLLEEAGLREESYLCVNQVKAQIDLSRTLIRQSYRDVHILIGVLADVIKKAIELNPALRNFQVIEDFEKKYAIMNT